MEFVLREECGLAIHLFHGDFGVGAEERILLQSEGAVLVVRPLHEFGAELAAQEGVVHKESFVAGRLLGTVFFSLDGVGGQLLLEFVDYEVRKGMLVA